MAFESLILDARGNPFQGTIDSIGGELITDARAATQTLASSNAEVLIDIQGKANVVFDLRTAAGNLTVVFEGSVNGTDYFALPAFAISQNLAAVLVAEQFVPSVVIATTCTSVYEIASSGFRRIRARVSAFTSGNVLVAARGSIADGIIYARALPATLHVTATASNATATASLPAAGVGLFHYITSINIARATTAAVTGTAILTHTTTNLPGSPAWSVGNAIAVGAQLQDVVYEPGNPLKSSVANTATTVVAAAGGVGVSGRVNVSYYVGS